MSKCIICKQEKEKNLCIRGKHICHDCEKEMVGCSVSDSRYEDLKNALKQILFPKVCEFRPRS